MSDDEVQGVMTIFTIFVAVFYVVYGILRRVEQDYKDELEHHCDEQ